MSRVLTEAEANERAWAVMDHLANHPEVWATHGLPTFLKQARIQAAIAAAMLSLAESLEGAQ